MKPESWTGQVTLISETIVAFAAVVELVKAVVSP